MKFCERKKRKKAQNAIKLQLPVENQNKKFPLWNIFKFITIQISKLEQKMGKILQVGPPNAEKNKKTLKKISFTIIERYKNLQLKFEDNKQ